MKNQQPKANHAQQCDLQRVIEPLASYLCAMPQPKTALKLALATLVAEIEQINLSALDQLAAFQEKQYAAPV